MAPASDAVSNGSFPMVATAALIASSRKTIAPLKSTGSPYLTASAAA